MSGNRASPPKVGANQSRLNNPAPASCFHSLRGSSDWLTLRTERFRPSQISSNAGQVVQRGSSGKCEESANASTIGSVLAGPGHPLSTEIRDFFEPRMGHDFSRVRVHVGREAGDSACAVGAIAYTVGQHIVLGTSLGLNENLGKQVLAHELIHTVQQPNLSGHPSLPQRISSPYDPSEREAERFSASLFSDSEPITLQQVQPHVARIPMTPGVSATGAAGGAQAQTDAGNILNYGGLPPRGANPGDCMKGTCADLLKIPVAGGTGLPQAAETWLGSAVFCVKSGASASNASHFAEISQNNSDELKGEVNELNQSIPASELRRRGAEYRSKLADICNRKQREAYLEFHYNVVFESGTPLRKWGALPGEWAEIQSALEGIPPEMTWGNPLLIRFRREVCAASDLASGTCAGTIGGDTDVKPDKSSATINVYDAGLGKSSMPRSTSLKIPATTQTIQHETGHVLESEISRAEYKRFFEYVLPWNMYSWAWITTRNSPYKNQAEDRAKLRAELQFGEDQLDTWLHGLALNSGAIVGDRTYFRGRFWLNSYPTALIPSGREFDYAKTGQGEYLAEVYAFALSKPEWLSSVLPPEQSAWLRKSVFHVPSDEAEWAIQLGEAVPTSFVNRVMRYYTWSQLKSLLNEFFAGKPRRGGQST